MSTIRTVAKAHPQRLVAHLVANSTTLASALPLHVSRQWLGGWPRRCAGLAWTVNVAVRDCALGRVGSRFRGSNCLGSRVLIVNELLRVGACGFPHPIRTPTDARRAIGLTIAFGKWAHRVNDWMVRHDSIPFHPAGRNRCRALNLAALAACRFRSRRRSCRR